jgi:geranylgeranyl transferase type-1 subunit beta
MRMGSFERDLLVKALLSMLDVLPSEYQGQDSHRVTLAYFVVSGLDILKALDQVDAKRIINWVYHLQVLPSDEDEDKPGFFLRLPRIIFRPLVKTF